MRRRVLLFAIAILTTVTVLVWTGVTAWRAADQLASRLSEDEVRTFQVGDTFSADLHEIRSLFRQYEATRNEAAWQHFEESRQRLADWLMLQREARSRPDEAALLREISTTFAQYGDECLRLRAEILAGVSRETIAPKIVRLGDLAADMAQDTRKILRLREEALQGAVGLARNRINRLIQILAGTLAALMVLSVALSAFVYRDLIRPLRLQLVETQDLMARQEKLASLGVLAAGVAHEIRNPLTAIKARLFTQQKRLPPASPAAQDAAIIHSEIQRLERIVREFLEFARPSEPRLDAVSARSLLAEVRDLILPTTQGPGADVRIELEPGPDVMLRADPAQLKQVLINLVQNAIDAIGTRGSVRLRAHRAPKRLGTQVREAAVVEVADDGPGITGEALDRLFDPFFTTKPDGTGLGLAIAARIVERHGGRLEFQTTPGEGTIFGIVIPLPR